MSGKELQAVRLPSTFFPPLVRMRPLTNLRSVCHNDSSAAGSVFTADQINERDWEVEGEGWGGQSQGMKCNRNCTESCHIQGRVGMD